MTVCHIIKIINEATTEWEEENVARRRKQFLNYDEFVCAIENNFDV